MTAPTTAAKPLLVNWPQVAGLLGMSARQAMRLPKQHADFPKPVPMGRYTRFNYDDICAWVESRRETAAAKAE